MGARLLSAAHGQVWNWNSALFQRAVRTKENRRNVDAPTTRADPRSLPFTPFLLGNGGIDSLGLRLGRTDRTTGSVADADFRIRIAIHARLDGPGLRNKPGHQGQHGEENTLHYVLI